MDWPSRLPVARSGPLQQRLVEGFAEIDGASLEVRRLKHQMWCVARDPDVTVFLGRVGDRQGAHRASHPRRSPRAGGPLSSSTAPRLSATLAEDTLFGHVRGAFTERSTSVPGCSSGRPAARSCSTRSGSAAGAADEAAPCDSVAHGATARRPARAFDLRIMAATNVDLAAARTGGDSATISTVSGCTRSPCRRCAGAAPRTSGRSSPPSCSASRSAGGSLLH